MKKSNGAVKVIPLPAKVNTTNRYKMKVVVRNTDKDRVKAMAERILENHYKKMKKKKPIKKSI